MGAERFRPRLAVQQSLELETTLELDEPPSHYLRTVLRAAPGTHVQLFNGDGHDYDARLEKVGKRCLVRVLTRRSNSNESPLHAELVQAISRGDRMDHSVQKAVELGVNRIQPVYSRQSIRPLDPSRSERKRSHWQSIAAAAAAQCGRAIIPAVATPLALGAWLERASTSTGETLDIVLVPDAARALSSPRPSPPTAVRLLVGPESGFEPDEVTAACRAGFRACRLGPRVLRTETAAPVGLAVLQTLYGDLGASRMRGVSGGVHDEDTDERACRGAQCHSAGTTLGETDTRQPGPERPHHDS